MTASRALYLLPLAFVVVGWFGFGAIIVLQRKRSTGRMKKIDRASIAGILLQTAAFAVVWSTGRLRGTPILPLGVWFHAATALAVSALVIGSLWIMSSAVRALGKQWSLQARVLEAHVLITEGPYRLVRHPIYTGMLGMLLAAALAISHWVGLIAGVALYSLGTVIRMRSEENLLREQFGEAYDAYARRTPPLLPFGKTS